MPADEIYRKQYIKIFIETAENRFFLGLCRLNENAHFVYARAAHFLKIFDPHNNYLCGKYTVNIKLNYFNQKQFKTFSNFFCLAFSIWRLFARIVGCAMVELAQTLRSG